MRMPAGQSLLERCRPGAIFVVAALALSMAGVPHFGAGPAAAGDIETAQQMREAGRFAEQFFEDIRDENYDRAYLGMDGRIRALGKFGVTGVLRAKRNYLIGADIEARYTFSTNIDPPEGLACVEARGKRPGKLYLAARMIRRSDSEGWKVRGFKITSVPESGCPA